MPLYHFSEDARIDHFVPRHVKVPAPRPAGKKWLNGALVWAIDDAHQRLYLFPRECPRILIWPTATTTAADHSRWLPDLSPEHEAVAVIERAWLGVLANCDLFRYELPIHTFEHTGEVGMWVSRTDVQPIARVRLCDLPTALQAARTRLRVVDSLLPYKTLWASTVHASGIRLRNARGWGPAGWHHSALSSQNIAQDRRQPPASEMT